MQTTLEKDAREFWLACDTVIRFVHTYDGLMNKEDREIIVTFIRAMAFDVASLASDPGVCALHRFRRMDH